MEKPNDSFRVNKLCRSVDKICRHASTTYDYNVILKVINKN